MDKQPASIFNDVIGPVMRGASSSHVAGSARIGALVRQSLGGLVSRAVVEFDANGSLAASYHGHGTDMGFVSGLLGLDLADPRVPEALAMAQRQGLDVSFQISDYGAEHPNNYRIRAFGPGGVSRSWEGVSVGGGMIEMRAFEGFSVSIDGGWFESLLLFDKAGSAPQAELRAALQALAGPEAVIQTAESAERRFFNLKRAAPFSASALNALQALPGLRDGVHLTPFLPTPSRPGCGVPFRTAEELLAYAEEDALPLWRLACVYESRRGGASDEHVFTQMGELFAIMENSLAEGLAGTDYPDRILGPQAYKIAEGRKNGALVRSAWLNSVIECVTAIMEAKSAMRVIVAAPTAGSCGCLPGALLGYGRAMGTERAELVKAMLAAGMIGVFIAESATFAAEVAGCQVECGAGSAMAAAGIAHLLGGTARHCLDAASMALQNLTGLACDPVADRVEVPCLGKNILGALNAVACANMALAGFDKVIPLDETIAAVYDAGRQLPLSLRCTVGGLGLTRTSLALRERLS